MSDHAMSSLSRLYKDLPCPDARDATIHFERLAEVFAKRKGALNDEDVHTVVWLVAPNLYDDVNALRYYLPQLLASCVRTGLLCDELECRLLQYQHEFAPEERTLITRILLDRWHDRPDEVDASDASFMLLWCEDLVPLTEKLREVAALQESQAETVYLERLIALRQAVGESDDPLLCLCRNLYFQMDKAPLERLRLEREGKIIQFLGAVEWFESASHDHLKDSEA